MPNETQGRLIAANGELREFLARVDCFVQGHANIEAGDLSRIRALLQSVSRVVLETRPTLPTDADLQALLREYAANLRATQKALQQIQCVMLARRARMDEERGRLSQLQGWANAYRQTT